MFPGGRPGGHGRLSRCRRGRHGRRDHGRRAALVLIGVLHDYTSIYDLMAGKHSWASWTRFIATVCDLELEVSACDFKIS